MASKLDLDKMTAQELNELIETATAALAQKREGAKNALVAEMREKAAQLGLELGDLLDKPGPRTNVRKPRSDAGKAVAARYRSPEGQEWTGRGRMPKWLTEALHHGKKKEDFAISA